MSRPPVSRRPRVALAPRLAGRRDTFLVESRAGAPDSTQRLFAVGARLDYDFDLVDAAAGGDFDALLVPHAFGILPIPADYAAATLDLARRLGVPALLYVGGDMSHAYAPQGFTLLKGTQYRDSRLPADLIVPPVCDDLGEAYGVTPRPFPTGKPTIGFCGWAAFGRWRTAVKAHAQAAALAVAERATGRPYRARTKGLIFRKRALATLARDSGVDCRFIVRNSFSANAATISLDPAEARRAYIENLVGCDFALAPKGDANYSLRFFEALSLGRVPVLIDTEVCLPAEDELAYERFVVRVPYRDIARTGDHIRRWLAAAGPDGFAEAQRLAREAFREHLRYDAFFNRLFARLAAERRLAPTPRLR